MTNFLLKNYSEPFLQEIKALKENLKIMALLIYPRIRANVNAVIPVEKLDYKLFQLNEIWIILNYICESRTANTFI